MFKDKMNYKLLNVLIFALIIYLGILTYGVWGMILSKLMSIIMPFIIAFGIAFSFYPIVRKLRKKGLSNSLSVTIVAGSVILVLAILLIITLPLLYDQVVVLAQSVSDVLKDFSNKFAVNLGDFQTTIDSVFDDLIKSIGKYVSDGTFNFVGQAVDFLSNAVIILILSIYFLADMEKIRAKVKKLLLRSKKRRRTYEYVSVLDKELGQYLNGLAIFIAVQFVEYTLLFYLIGHPNWLLLGVLASLTTVIPYFGGLITNIVAVILASVVSSKLFILTLIICLVFPNVDGYIISPRIYGKTNNINAMWTIFAVVAGGALFGIPGIMISLPAYIAINCTLNFYKEDILDKVGSIKDQAEENKEVIEKEKEKVKEKNKK